MRSALHREPLYAVVLVDRDHEGFSGEGIAARGLTKEAAERAAAKIDDDGIFVAVIRKMPWRLVAVA